MPLDIRIRFGRAIRRIREEQKINQEEAAERCGLHRTYYSGVERGVRNVSVRTGRIAAVLSPERALGLGYRGGKSDTPLGASK